MRGMRPKMESCNFTRTSFKSALFNALGIFAFWYREMGSGFGLSMSLPLPCYEAMRERTIEDTAMLTSRQALFSLFPSQW